MLTLAAPAAAQRAPAELDELQQMRYQLQTFEVVLQAAVRHGGDAFARQLQAQFLAGIQLTANEPQARGFAPPHGGELLFYVSVPSIRPMVVEELVLWPRSSARRGAAEGHAGCGSAADRRHRRRGHRAARSDGRVTGAAARRRPRSAARRRPLRVARQAAGGVPESELRLRRGRL
jgi:hypothetical protein